MQIEVAADIYLDFFNKLSLSQIVTREHCSLNTQKVSGIDDSV